MDHATKLCERIIDEKLKHEKLKHELIYLKPIWSSSRKINSESYIHYQEVDGEIQQEEKILTCGIIDLDKTYDMIQWQVIWYVLVTKHAYKRYIYAIKDMYDGAITSVRTIEGKTSCF